jgi:hypothetical protein
MVIAARPGPLRATQKAAEPNGEGTQHYVTYLPVVAQPVPAAPQGDCPASSAAHFNLFAEAQRITLAYMRDDNPGWGYVLHIESVCVDPNLLSLYRSQNSQGWRSTGSLPALRNGERLGTALGQEVVVAIRDRGQFMDPRAEGLVAVGGVRDEA